MNNRTFHDCHDDIYPFVGSYCILSASNGLGSHFLIPSLPLGQLAAHWVTVAFFLGPVSAIPTDSTFVFFPCMIHLSPVTLAQVELLAEKCDRAEKIVPEYLEIKLEKDLNWI